MIKTGNNIDIEKELLFFSICQNHTKIQNKSEFFWFFDYRPLNEAIKEPEAS